MGRKADKKNAQTSFSEVENELTEFVVDIWKLKIPEEDKKILIAKCQHICELMDKMGLMQDKG